MIDAGSVHNHADANELPSTAREIADLAQIYPRPVILAGAQCTKDNVVRTLTAAEMIHFAGHGLTGSGVIDPALVLSPSNGDGGLLYPRDIADLRLQRLRLVVLGACSTASGQIGSEGAMSIARAFIAGGSERVVATLWPVEDDATRILVTSLHRALSGSVDPAAALRTAQTRAIRNSLPPHQWAAFEILQRGL